MRQETNNEMDLLLRRLSGREAGGARDGETGLGERHLDVDELSSYAQNVLPTAARARYTEHLAECASCRKLVAELALSLGTVTAAAPVKTGLARTGLKAFLASLFSPMVLRYAIPALGLILVAVVGFVALRKPSNERFVAKVGDEQKELRVREPVAPGLVARTPPESLEGFHDNRPAKPQNEQERVDQRIEEKGDAGKGEGAAAGAVPAPLTKPADEVQSTSSEARPTTSAAEAPPAASKVGAATAAPSRDTETSKEKKAEAQAKKQPETTDIVVDGADANANKPAKNEVTERRVADLPVQNRSQGLQKLRAGTRAAEDKDTTEKESTETRSVAGRTFKKERGIWIDTAYDSSTRTRNLARGSESFRALVADEPAINTIAEQLDGEVIVVWKGRAYRIR